MSARSPAFICATALTCVLLVEGDRSAEFDELFANTGSPGLTAPQMKDRRLAQCYSMKKKADCEAMKKGCGGCKWKNSSLVPDGQCSAPGCSDYKDPTSCCANAMKVDEGCYWQKTNSRNISKCVAMTCDTVAEVCTIGTGHNCSEAKMACKAQKGCTYHDDRKECKGSNWKCTSESCSATVKSVPSDCPVLVCSECIGSCTLPSLPECTAQYKKDLEGKCADKCKGVVHCVEEVTCLRGKTAENEPKCDQKGSCVAELVYPHPTTCEAACQDFDNRCQKCGSKTTCGGGSGGSSGTARVAPFTSVAMSCIAAVFLTVKH